MNHQNHQKKISRKEWASLGISIFLCLLLLFLQFYRWDIIDVITPILEWPLEMALYLTFFIILTVLTFFGLRDLRDGRRARIMASGVMVLTYLSTLIVNFNGIWLDHYFAKYKDQRHEVIRMIEDGKLQPNIPHDPKQIHLPNPLSQTSMGGGDIRFENETSDKKVFFYSFRGVLDAYAGFYYSSEDLPPAQNSLGLEFNDAIKLEPKWYWIGTCTRKNEALGVLLKLAPLLRCS